MTVDVTEYVNFEDLTFENWTSTTSGEIGLVAGAYFPASDGVW